MSNKKNKLEKAFPSAEILLSIAQDEYSKERERSCNLDNKAGLFATIIIAIITLYMQIIPLSEIVPAYIKAAKWQCTALTIILGIMGLGLSCFVAAFVDIYRAIKVKPFNRVNFDNLTSLELLAADPDKTAEAMIRHYRQIVAETNVKISDEKAEYIQHGLRKTMVGFVFVSIAAISFIIFIGGLNG